MGPNGFTKTWLKVAYPMQIKRLRKQMAEADSEFMTKNIMKEVLESIGVPKTLVERVGARMWLQL